MTGLTWLSHQKTSASQTSPAAAHQPAGAQKRQKGVPGADYGELDLGTFSAEDAHKVAEARAIDDARAIEASNPYARLPKLATADATSTHGTKGSKTRPSWDMVADDTPSDRTAVNQIEAPIQGDAPAPAGSVPKGGWDLILCSFAFAEKDVGSAAESRHLKEVSHALSSYTTFATPHSRYKYTATRLYLPSLLTLSPLSRPFGCGGTKPSEFSSSDRLQMMWW